MGQSYLLGCPEGGEDKLRTAVLRVDEAMCKIRDAGKVRARDRIAVLAALNLAFDLSERPAPSAAASDSTAAAEVDGDALRALLGRLDEALSEDGQLL